MHTDLEFDNYFQSVVAPAVGAADAALIELYEFPHAASEWEGTCPNESPAQFSKSNHLLSKMKVYLDIKNPETKAINAQIAKLRLSFPGFAIDGALNGETYSNLEKYLSHFHGFSFDGVGATVAKSLNPNLIFELDGPVIQKNAFCMRVPIYKKNLFHTESSRREND